MGIIVDSFAGGGGASTGIEMALGRSPDIAINHSREALALHSVNHPDTIHMVSDIWEVPPAEVVRQHGPIDLLWASPDCRHFSKAKGGRPVKKNIRSLAWVVIRWAAKARPRGILLENVEEFKSWGPLNDDGRPCRERMGQTFKAWVEQLERLGYRVEWRELVASDYGAPTQRKRLFVIARCDGMPIVWPPATHGNPTSLAVQNGLLRPWRTAADIIDWSIECPSIFMTAEQARTRSIETGARIVRPLAPATLARIAKGVKRYVLDAQAPYLVPAPAGSGGPGSASVVAAFMAQHNGGMVGHDMRSPVSTLTMRGTQQQLVAAHMINLKGLERRSGAVDAPCPTLTAGGRHVGLVAAFLHKYYGTDQAPELREPLHTLTTKERFALITVNLAGEDYVLADIGMRMLTAREMFRAQGFPETYEIENSAIGPLSKTAQTRLCGNSVCPPIAEALVGANFPNLAQSAHAERAFNEVHAHG